MKRIFCALLLLCSTGPLSIAQQLNVTYSVNTGAARKPISPYIYGMNNGGYRDASWRRLGGNRLPVYNWENNFSHAGQDWFHHNDDYLPFIFGVPPASYRVPGIVLRTFHDTSLAQGAMSAVTLPMAGFVSSDNSGEVFPGQLAPSSRWDAVVNIKGAPLSLTPDTADQSVFVDEALNFLINHYGKSHTAGGIKAYVLDNEPGLWCYQYPRMRNNCVTYAELFSKSVALSTLVKDTDSAALVMGPESWGFSEYWDLQGAPDPVAGDHWFVDSYLKAMSNASAGAGKRLLDIFTVHWYPQVNGVFSGDTSMAAAKERMQSTRSLWDSSYTENSWITASGFGGELPLIPHLQHSIAQFYPGTALGITEYGWGAQDHISGGIAQADLLGIFGKWRLDYAAIWPEIEGYLRSAFDLYLNYDGQGGSFGSISVGSTTNDIANAPVYASVADSTNRTLHLILMNKNYDSTINAQIHVTGNRTYHKGHAYYFNRNSMALQQSVLPAGALSANTLQYSIPPLSVYHLVLEDTTVLGVNDGAATNVPALEVFPNPAHGAATVAYDLGGKIGRLELIDVSGRIVRSVALKGSGKEHITLPSAGMYFLHLTDGIRQTCRKLSSL